MDAAQHVIVIPSRVFNGLSGLDPAKWPKGKDAPSPAVLATLNQAFKGSWETDAHFLLYLPSPLSSDEPIYRLNKSSLGDVRAAGGDVLLFFIAVDWDTGKGPEHVPWTPQTFDRFWVAVDEASKRGLRARLESAYAFYTTEKGARWVFRLHYGVPVDRAEGMIRGLYSEFREAGLDVDSNPTTHTWTQPFRLPRVRRVETVPTVSAESVA